MHVEKFARENWNFSGGEGQRRGRGKAKEEGRENARLATIPGKLFILAAPRVLLDKLASCKLQFARLLIQTLPSGFIITRGNVPAGVRAQFALGRTKRHDEGRAAISAARRATDNLNNAIIKCEK